MVELPSGRMKSREGTVVDADDMVEEMIRLSKEQAEQAGKTEGFTKEELDTLYNMVGLGALKFYLLRVEPRKKMIFDPKESIDLHGFTATFIQYAHVRICSILRKNELAYGQFKLGTDLAPLEKTLLLKAEQYPSILAQAAAEFNPSLICTYTFQLAQLFNSFFDKHSISNAESEEKKQLRLMLIKLIGNVIQNAMRLLGIEVPQKM
jgi:arginyl-tRNA synthetase